MNIKKLFAVLLMICIIFSVSSCTLPTEDIAYITVNDNIPQFEETLVTTTSFEQYSILDELGRCGPALACIGTDIMPDEERGTIGQVKPSGWQTAKYDFVDGKYLYNRCHLIGYQLTGENANERNLITGTRYMNVEGMLPFENEVAEYVRETKNHVMYRVIPVFEGNNLVASGVQMEALSVEDDGKGVSFNVYVINKQPGVEINYADGTNRLSSGEENNVYEMPCVRDNSVRKPAPNKDGIVYILNNGTMKFHYSSCSSVKDIKPKNREEYNGNKEYLVDIGYVPCGACRP